MEVFRKNMHEEDWKDVYTTDDPNEMMRSFLNIFLYVKAMSIPAKYAFQSNWKPTANPILRNIRETLQLMLETYKQTNDPNYKVIYTNYKKFYLSEVEKVKKITLHATNANGQ